MEKKNNRFVLFLKKVWKRLTHYPTMITLIFIVPFVLFLGRYFVTGDYLYSNLNFEGHTFSVTHENFRITKINHIKKIVDISSYSNYQGGTCFRNYYLLCSNNFECILIYDTDTMKVAHTIYTGMTNTDYHCNTLFFGSSFYSSVDKFPILYISMENVNQTIGFHIYEKGGVFSIEKIQTITLKFNDSNRLYYPNSYYDYEHDLLYYSGYTKKGSYRKADDNLLRYHVFSMPDYRLQEVELDVKDDALDTFDLPSETAAQGGFISENYLYQTFSFNKKNDPLNCPKFRVIDLKNKSLLHDFQDIGQYGQYDEFENVAVTDDNRLIGFGITTLSLYQFVYEDTSN